MQRALRANLARLHPTLLNTGRGTPESSRQPRGFGCTDTPSTGLLPYAAPACAPCRAASSSRSCASTRCSSASAEAPPWAPALAF